MNRFSYFLINIFETLIRVFPLPCKTGLVEIGHPGPDSPVFLTCNYHLTVQRVKKSLKGMDCYLLIANSRGVNVWCAATGGLFTHHDVISVLKISGIEARVNHREVILPQLAATGVEARVIREKTGWKVHWGPVYAADLPSYIQNHRHKTAAMRQVRFPLLQRMEMAVAWAFPISLVASLLSLPFRAQIIVPLTLLVWSLSFLIFIAFPLYHRWLKWEGKRIGFVFFDFGKGGIQFIVWALFMLGFAVVTKISGNFSGEALLRWGFLSFIVVLIISIDLPGSTPLTKSSLHPDRLFQTRIDLTRCHGAGVCEQVCPRNCFVIDKGKHTAAIPGIERCVRCGACIVQCPFDALFFQNPQGEIIPPETVRTFKLNLLGKRARKTG